MRHVVERLQALIFLVLLNALLFLSGCGNKEQLVTKDRPAAPVVVAGVELRNIPVQIKAIGNVEAYQTVQIRSQVSGQIQKIFFKEGEDVRQGQLLFQLDKSLDHGRGRHPGLLRRARLRRELPVVAGQRRPHH